MKQKTISGEDLLFKDSFCLVYSGPSFKEGFEIKKLSENLRATQEIIIEFFEQAKSKKITNNSGDEIKQILVYLKKGSVEEHLTIIFSNPEIRGIFIDFMMAWFFYLLGTMDSEKFKEEIFQRLDLLEEMVILGPGEDLKKLYAPLEKKGDSLKIRYLEKEYELLSIEDKAKITKIISDKQKEAKTDTSIEYVKGYVSAINIDTKKLRFHPENDTRSYPLLVKGHFETLASQIGKTAKIKLKVCRVNSIVKSYEFIEQNTTERRISDFK